MSHRGTEPTSAPEAWRERGLEVEKGTAKTLSMMLRNVGMGLYKAHCQHCQFIGDMFGVLKPGLVNDAGEVLSGGDLSTIEQRCIEHLGECGRTVGVLIGQEVIREALVLQNRNTPEIFKFQTIWR